MIRLDKFNLTQKIAYNAVFSVLTRLLEMLIALVTLKFTTTYLGVEGFGDYGTVLAFVYIFSVLADFGLYSLVVRDISVPEADESRIINNALTIRLVLGLGVMLSAYALSFLFPYSSLVRLGILVASLGYWLLNAIQVLMGLFQKHLLMDRVSVAEFAGRVVQFVGVWIGVKYDLGFLFITGTVLLGALFNLFLIWFYTRRLVRLQLAFDFSYWKDMLRRAYPLALSALLVLVYFKMDTIFLSVIKGSGAVGVYSLAYKIMENLIFFPAMVVGLTMPLMSRTAFTDRAQFQSIVQRTLDFLLLAIVPIVLGILAVSDQLILLLSEEAFHDAVLVLDILALALIFIFLGALFSNVLVALTEQKQLARIYACGAVFNVAANLYFIPRYSYFGAAFTTFATELLVTGLMMIIIRRKIHYLPSFANLARTGAAGLLMFAVLRAFPALPLAPMVLLGAGVYAAAAYALGGVSQEEVRKLLQKRA
jgi:O-antigen/teichoic acid export membrane protein